MSLKRKIESFSEKTFAAAALYRRRDMPLWQYGYKATIRHVKSAITSPVITRR